MGPSNSRLEIREKYSIVKRSRNIQARISKSTGHSDAANLQIGRLCLAPRRSLVATAVVFRHWAPATSQGTDRLAEDTSPADRRAVCQTPYGFFTLQMTAAPTNLGHFRSLQRTWSSPKRPLVMSSESTGLLANAVYRRFF